MRLKKMHYIGISFGMVVLAVAVYIFFILKDKNLSFFLMGISCSVIILPFIIGLMIENRKEQDVAEMFLEFSRNLAESVATGSTTTI